jgi:2-polyprenyl-3-methyl-5-hydroxy-6-metoxy-1,4-benzoquinol methylase
MTEWFENEAFWEELFPFLFPETRFAAAEAEVEKILRLVTFRGSTVLDLACGPGRHSMILAKRGYRVTGVDRSSYLLHRARTGAQEAGVEVEWVEEDMQDFIRPDAFDLVLNMFTSFGYFEKREDDFRVLQNVWRSLRAGGVCLLDMMGKERVARQFQPALCHNLSDGSLLIERPKIIDDWSRVQQEWILIRGERARRFGFCHRIYSGQELNDLLYRAGFSMVKLYGDLDGGEYGIEASRLIAACSK